MWTPSDRWQPAHCVHRNTPVLTLAQVGSLAVQSAQVAFSSCSSRDLGRERHTVVMVKYVGIGYGHGCVGVFMYSHEQNLVAGPRGAVRGRARPVRADLCFQYIRALPGVERLFLLNKDRYLLDEG